MSKDKYPSIISRQMEAIVFIILQFFFAMRAIFKIGEYSRIFPILGDPGATCRDDAIDILGRKSTSRAEALTWGLGTNTLPSRYIDRKFLWAISRLLFLVAGKASRVLVHRCITSETFHNVQNANRRCTSHAIMLTERGNYGLIPMHALFLAIGPNQKSLSSCCMKALSH